MAYILSKQDIESLFLTKNIPLRINAVTGLVTFMTSRDVIIPSQTDNPSLVKNGQCEVKGLIEVAQRFGKECLVVLPNQIISIDEIVF